MHGAIQLAPVMFFAKARYFQKGNTYFVAQIASNLLSGKQETITTAHFRNKEKFEIARQA